MEWEVGGEFGGGFGGFGDKVLKWNSPQMRSAGWTPAPSDTNSPELYKSFFTQWRGHKHTHSQTNVFLLFTPTHPNAGTLVDTHNLTTVLIIPPWNKHKHFFFFYLKQPWLKFGDKISWGILFKVSDSTHNVSKQPHNCHHILIQMFLNSDWCTWMHDITPSQRSHPLKPVILPPATDTNGEKFCRDIT